MIIAPLPGPNNQHPANFPNDAAAVALNEAIEALQAMFDEYFNEVEGVPNGGNPLDCENDDCCCTCL
jgi:hypothetical protein